MPGFNFIYTALFNSHSYRPRFCLFFLPFFLQSLGLGFTTFSAHVASWHVARLGPNIFILLHSGWNPFSVLLRVYKSSFRHVVPSGVKPCNGL